MKRYLLRQLNPDERASLERDYFEDDEWFEELLAAEEDLIDAYVHDQLGPGEREAFERTYLSTPEGQDRIRLAQALNGAVARLEAGHATLSRSAPAGLARVRLGAGRRFLLPAAAVCVVSVGVWAALQMVSSREAFNEVRVAGEALRRDLDAARQEAVRERARADTYQDEIRRMQSRTNSQAAPQTSSVATLSLAPVTVRDVAGPDELVLPGVAAIVVLELAIDVQQKLESVRVVLASNGRAVAHVEMFDGLPTLPGVIVVPLPSSTFVPGVTYTASVETPAVGPTRKTLHTYEFRATR